MTCLKISHNPELINLFSVALLQELIHCATNISEYLKFRLSSPTSSPKPFA